MLAFNALAYFAAKDRHKVNEGLFYWLIGRRTFEKHQLGEDYWLLRLLKKYYNVNSLTTVKFFWLHEIYTVEIKYMRMHTHTWI